MSFWNFLSGGVVNSVERIASEWIETDMESAEARAVMVKAIDPNGKMRRDLARVASNLYVFYLVSTSILIFLHAYGIGDGEASKEAMESMTSLFLPVTGAWTAIVSASFGVNVSNNWKEKNMSMNK